MWMRDLTYVITILAAVVFAIIFSGRLKHLRKSLFMFDTIGIGFYTMVGIEKGLQAELLPIMCIALGTITASFGGVIRDMLCNEIPVIFQKEIYATACILGGSLYFLLQFFSVPEAYAYVLGIVGVIALRLAAVKFGIVLPSIYRKEN